MRFTRLRRAVIGVWGFAIMTRSFLKAVARGLIGVVLMTQVVISAYACPAMAGAAAVTQHMPAERASAGDRSDADTAMPMAQAGNCDDMAGALDTSSPNLCAEHCKQGQQSADHTPSPAVAQALLTALYRVTLSTATPTAEAAYYVPGMLLRAADPPHAIAHCCLRY